MNINDKVIKELSKQKSLEVVYHSPVNNELMPSHNDLTEIVNLLRKIIFPGYFGNASINNNNIEYYLGVNINNLVPLLREQIKRGLFFDCSNNSDLPCDKIYERADKITQEFISKLPDIRKKLSTDVIAGYLGDPAAKGYGEVIFCYPAIRALTNYRIANALLKLKVPLIPRIITEMAHSETGIDIHPGAEIGEHFAIDHGTGVVIGETCIIGKNVKIYQGVTLGAKSFPIDENGNPIKGIARHPIVKDNVVIYAEATILGRVTIGENSTIGGNMWITHDVEPNTKILQR
ncbi:MAG: serine acetyltransferase [Bacteroidetes bacterium]|nr:MAG: serine acetyltransferase [Bacteroidota bacterium]